MLQKRPLGEEVYDDVSTKQPRHMESGDDRVSVLEFPGYHKTTPENDEMLDGGYLSELQACKENEVTPCSISNSSWTESTTSEEDIKSEVPFCVVLSPDHYNLELPPTTIISSRDIYSYLLERSPHKLVPIGNDFQAELSEWVGRSETFPSSSSGDDSKVLNLVSVSGKSDISDQSANEDKFTGSCIIPMPEVPMSADATGVGGGRRTCCSCDDVGSIRCIRQHIDDARKTLRKTLGEEAFMKLGFYDMGGVVAEKWSEEEEDIFREIVFRYSAFRKNFWNELAIQLPSRTMKELVSYYFNVFILRKRAEQNRVDLLDIDSDNDTWEEVHFSADNVVHELDVCDDSDGESPEHEEDFGRDEMYGNNTSKSNEVFTLETVEDKTHENVDGNKCVASMSEICQNDAFRNCGSGPAHQLLDQAVSDELRKHDIEDVTCPSYKIGIATDVARRKAYDIRHTSSNHLSGLSSSSGHEFLTEPGSSEEWDVGYMACSKDEDFLPTCSVIEEVFGSGVCNYKN